MTADLKNEAQKALDAYDKYESHRDALQFAAAIESLRKAVELQAPAEAHDDGDELTAAYMAGAHDARKAHCLTTRQIEVLTFLAGEGTLDGHWFEPDRKPKFWWRTALREAFGADVSKAQPKGTEQTRSQRLAEAGYTRRLSWKSLPKDGDDETQKPIGIVGPAGGDEVEWRGNTIPPEGTRLYAEPIQAPAPAPETGDTNGRRDGLRSAVHGRVPVGGHTPGALADLLWASPDVMGLNAELGLTMDQLVQLTQAVLTAVPCAAVAHQAPPGYRLITEEFMDWIGALPEAKAQRRLEWLHSPESNNVDGYEWGVYRVKWEHGKAVEVWHTNSDFSDLDAAMASQPPVQGSEQ